MGTMGLASQELEKAPRALRETLLFPYQQGTDWSKNLYKQGGWERVSKAFTELPQSTEQILHAEKYFTHEAPVTVTLSDITDLLNAGNPSRSPSRSAGILPALSAKREQFVSTNGSSELGRAEVKSVPPASSTQARWKKLDYDVQGEWGLYLILDEFLKAPAESRRAAAGWGGDRYAVYEGPKGEILFASISTWDTENDAREFFEAYVKRTELRFPGTTPTTPNLQSATASKAFRTSEGTVIVELRGTRAAVVEGLPGRVDGKSFLKALWVEPSLK
jgi:hypothetical protein